MISAVRFVIFHWVFSLPKPANMKQKSYSYDRMYSFLVRSGRIADPSNGTRISACMYSNKPYLGTRLRTELGKTRMGGSCIMIGPDERNDPSAKKHSSLWFNVDEVDTTIEKLNHNDLQMEIEPETSYGRKVVSFSDLNGFAVSFCCDLRIKKKCSSQFNRGYFIVHLFFKTFGKVLY